MGTASSAPRRLLLCPLPRSLMALLLPGQSAFWVLPPTAAPFSR